MAVEAGAGAQVGGLGQPPGGGAAGDAEPFGQHEFEAGCPEHAGVGGGGQVSGQGVIEGRGRPGQGLAAGQHVEEFFGGEPVEAATGQRGGRGLGGGQCCQDGVPVGVCTVPHV